MENYKELLNKAYEKVKVVEKTGNRFEVPNIEGHFVGKRTILTNLQQIASYLRRDEDHLLRFLLKELSVKGTKENERVILTAKVSSKKINPKIEEYVNEFVLCRECKKPDTEIEKQGKISIIHCLACGAKHPVRGKF